MDNVLVVSSSQKASAFFTDLLQTYHPSQILTVENGGQARRILLDSMFDVVIINTPLSDEFGRELSQNIAETTAAGVLLVVGAEYADEVSEKVEDFGVFVLPKPMNRQLFFQSIKLLEASRRRMLGLKRENDKLHNKIEEIKLVDRAKCVLIECQGLTESQAHRQIEKQAMDYRMLILFLLFYLYLACMFLFTDKRDIITVQERARSNK